VGAHTHADSHPATHQYTDTVAYGHTESVADAN
jgi:hypothetical protein